MSQPIVYLASKSPRRLEILRQLGHCVKVIASNDHTRLAFAGDEEILPGESPADYVVRTAGNKFLEGLHVRSTLDDADPAHPVIAADTVVSLDGEVLGKPVDRAQAESFLRKLSGRTHDVRTAVFVGTAADRVEHAVSLSRVTFKELTDEEIQAYCQTGEPYDKAGGYGIQGLAGIFISRIDGSYTGIMGLPVFETNALLSKAGAPAL